MLIKLRIAVGITLILSALAISGFYALTHAPRTGSSGEAPAGAPPAPARGEMVVVARAPIARGQRLTADALALMEVQGPLLGTPYRDVAAATGGVARQGLAAGQILMTTDVAGAQKRAGSLALLVPRGMRAVALSVNDEVAVSSFITPSDRVDIQLVFSAEQVLRLALADGDDKTLQSRILLQNIEVLSTGETLRAATDGKPVRMQTLTVAVTPRQAQLLAVAKESGSFYLALRHPRDDMLTALPPFSARLLGGVPRPADVSAAPRTVEVLTGGTSHRMAVEEHP